jgi:diguanylate cyclase (GGDEF)-like protein/PAS domain S-box-containing protein
MADDWRARVEDVGRLAVLRRTGLLDTPSNDAFDGLTWLSAELLGVPVALVSLVDRERQFFKSAVGLDEPWASRRETPLSHSFCKHVVASGKPLVVDDARHSSLLRENGAVRDLGVIAYAGVPLHAAGEPIGAFCAIDREPRTWSDRELKILRAVARAVETQIALGLANETLAEREQLLDAVLTTMPAGFVVRDVAGAVLRTNPALERLLGRSAAELAGTDFWTLTHPDEVAGDMESRDSLLAGERETARRVKRFRHAAGHYVWVRLSAAVLRDRAGRTQGTVAVVEDITAERHAEQVVTHQARIYATIARNIPRGAVLLFDREMRYLAADGTELLASIGLERSELEGRTLQEVVSPEHRKPAELSYRQALLGNSATYEATRLGRVLQTRVAPVFDGETVTGGVALIQDVTEEREQAQRVEQAKALFEATIANVHDGVVVLDRDRRVLYANRAYAELLGLERSTLLASTREDFFRHMTPLVADPDAFRRSIDEQHPTAEGTTLEVTLVRPRLKHLRRTIAPLALPDGPGWLVVWQDVSLERELLAERERQALSDALTGIPNRRAAELELQKALARSLRGKTPLSLALFDVDHFKRVNDLHGHATGDEVLKAVAAVLDQAKRLTDTVARWGGEEFIAILPVPLGGAATFCDRVRAQIAELSLPGVGRVTISAGVAELGPEDAGEALLARADQRLYAAKAGGRNRVQAS